MRSRLGNHHVLGVALLLVLVGSFLVVGLDTGPAESNTTVTPPPEFDTISFEDVAVQKGFNYTPPVPENPGQMENGGVYVTDYNEDGWPDLLAVGGRAPVLFENTGGAFERSGALPSIEGFVKAALFFDYDADGTEDLLLLRTNATPVLLENEGSTFERRNAGFETSLVVPKSASAADYDRDGCLDVFVIQNQNWAESVPAKSRVNVINDSATEDNGNPNVLFEGDCERFRDVTEEADIDGKHWSLSTSFVDLNDDGYPDIHVANDYSHDIVHWNRGNGTFETVVLGDKTNRNGMSSEITDVNGDGRLDIFVSNIYLPSPVRRVMPRIGSRGLGNNMLVNQGNGSFVDRADAYGVRIGGWAWSAVSADFDNDMDRDLFHATQSVPFDSTMQRYIDRRIYSHDDFYDLYPFLTYPRLFERRNDRFATRNASKFGFVSSSGTGVAQIDYDRDGDVDLAIAQPAGTFKLFENRAEGGGSILIDVEATEQHLASGAKVYVTVGNATQMRVRNSKADFLSQDTRYLHVGTGANATIDRIRVVWPDGTERVLTDVPANGQLLEVEP